MLFYTDSSINKYNWPYRRNHGMFSQFKEWIAILNQIACCHQNILCYNRSGYLLSEIAHLIQKQVPLHSCVELSLKNGDKVSGILNEISPFHLTLNLPSGEFYTCLISTIEAWRSISRDCANYQFEQSKVSAPEESACLEQLHTKTTSPFPKIEETNTIPSKNISFDQEAQKKLIEIYISFDDNVQVIRHIIKPPDFKKVLIDELKQSTDSRLFHEGQNIFQRYRYAVYNERDPFSKRSRLSNIVTDLKLLIKDAPFTTGLKRVLAYVQYELEELSNTLESSDALKNYKELCVISHSADDWYNLSVLAEMNNDSLLACYALEQILISSGLQQELSAWYIYINHIKSSKKYFLLRKLFTHLKSNLPTNDARIFLETCIYLLKKMENEYIALKLVQSLLRALHQETSIQPLLEETLSHFEEIPSNDPYAHIEAEMDSLHQRIANEQQKGNSIFQSLGEPIPAKKYTAITSKDESAYEKALKIIADDEDLENAIPFLREAIAKQDNAKDAIKRLCAIYQKQKDQEEIIALLQDQNHKGLVSEEYKDKMLADVYWQTKKYEEMLEILPRMIKDVKQDTKIVHRYEQMSICYEKLEKMDKAKECYRKMIDPLKNIIRDLPASTANAIKMFRYRQIGKCYIQIEQFEEAEKWFEKIIEIDKNDQVALENLKYCKIKLGKYDEQEQEFQNYYFSVGEEYTIDKEDEEEQANQSLLVLYETERELCCMIEKVLNEKGSKQWIRSILLLRETEKGLRRLITKVLQEKYGKKWIEELKEQCSEIINNCYKVQREDIEMKNKPSPNLLDYTHIRDLFEIISKNWDTCFSPIFHQDQKDKHYWEQCGDHIAEVRNRLAHHRSEVISQANHSRYEEICHEILQIVRARNSI